MIQFNMAWKFGFPFNTKQTNDGVISNKSGKNFNSEKLFLNVRVRL